MAKRNEYRLVIDDLRGGRNGYDPPTALPDTQCVDAVNVNWSGGKCVATKRNGSTAIGFTTVTDWFDTSYGVWLYRHVPGADLTKAQFWAGGSKVGTAAPTIWYADGGLALTAVTLVDTINLNMYDAMGASFNGKLFFAQDSNVNYLHVWDGTSFRRVGITVPAAPTVADGGGVGTYAATARYYKVAYTIQSSGVTIRRSELSPASTVFTPDGAHANATITKPAATSPTCGETHWEIYGSQDDTSYSLLGTVAVGTTTAADTSDPNNYAADFPTGAPLAGTNTPPPSCKYIITFNNRLVMASAWETSGGETTPKNNRVWFTPVLGASDVGDDERVPSNYYIDLNENGGSPITGLAELFGDVYVFCKEQIWALHTTGDADAPFEARLVSATIGATSQRTIVTAEDHAGIPALYFASTRGMYRLGAGGLVYIGRPVEDIWSRNITSTNQLSTHGVYYADERQVWIWTYQDTTTQVLLIYDVGLDAWSRYSGSIAKARASCMFSNTIGSSMSYDLKPYMLDSQNGLKIVKCDTGTVDWDDATTGAGISASVTLKPYLFGDIEYRFGVSNPIVVMTTGTDIEMKMLYRPDFGAQADVFDTRTVTADGSETRTRLVFDGLQTSGVFAVQPIVSNTDVDGAGWTVDRILLRYTPEESAP